MDKSIIPKPVKDFKIIDMSDGVVIEKDGVLHTLNTSAFEIFKLCDGSCTVQNIIDTMKDRYKGDNIEFHIESFLDQLGDIDLISV